MAAEHERKFVLTDDGWRQQALSSVSIIQGYMQQQENCSVRVRVCSDASGSSHCTINIKSVTIGVSRHEFEYDIPEEDARQMLELLCAKPLLSKTRHYLDYQGQRWEIDEFSGENQGLVVAELELEEPRQQFAKPPWLGKEVSDDPRYYNTCLQMRPYNTWEAG